LKNLPFGQKKSPFKVGPWKVWFFLAVMGLKLRAFPLSHSTSPIFCDRVFQDRVLRTSCPGWLWTAILLISASWVARIIDMSCQHPAGKVWLLKRQVPLKRSQVGWQNGSSGRWSAQQVWGPEFKHQ
jgi:hypothetical protein